MASRNAPRSGQVVAAVMKVFVVVVLALLAFVAGRRAPRRPTSGSSHQVVVEQIQKVAQLVSTKVNVRDVFEYHDTRHFSTRRVLLIVSGHLNFGMDLKGNPPPEIDDRAKTISVSLPHAKILDVVQDDLVYYDVHQGLFNRFALGDAAWLQHSADSTLRAAGTQLGITEHADSSAAETLRALLKREGYTVNVIFR
jgi:hypothetical protein